MKIKEFTNKLIICDEIRKKRYKDVTRYDLIRGLMSEINCLEREGKSGHGRAAGREYDRRLNGYYGG